MDQEGRKVVLRFLLSAGGETIPCEVRAAGIRGFLRDGDEVAISVRGGSIRNRQGLAQPRRITNLTTHSTISARGPGFFSRVLGLAGRMTFSLASGVLVTVIVGIPLNSLVNEDGGPDVGITTDSGDNGNGDKPEIIAIPFILEKDSGEGGGEGDASGLITFIAVSVAISLLIYVVALVILPKIRGT